MFLNLIWTYISLFFLNFCCYRFILSAWGITRQLTAYYFCYLIFAFLFSQSFWTKLQMNMNYRSVLCLAGMRLIFFTVAHYGAVFWTCGYNSLGSTPISLLLLSSGCKASRLSLLQCWPFFLFLPPYIKLWKIYEGHSQDSWLKFAKAIFHTIRKRVQARKLDVEE